MSLTKAANTLTNFNGTASLTPLLGALLTDSYAGKFWTITTLAEPPPTAAPAPSTPHLVKATKEGYMLELILLLWANFH